jgi:AcrR family transcriptional regulator
MYVMAARARNKRAVDRDVDPRVIERKRQIIAQAAVLLRQRDYFGFSVDDLADALEINKTTFYRYFVSKEQMLFELHETAMDEFHAMASSVLETEVSPPEQLAGLVRGHVALQQRPGVSALTIPQLYVFSEPYRKVVLVRRDWYEGIYREVIYRGIHEGNFRPVNPKLFSLLLLGTLNSIQNWYKMSGPLPPAELADGIIEVYLHGVLLDPKREASEGRSRV